MTESDAQVSAERWVIDVYRGLRLPAAAAEDDFLSTGGTSLTPHLMARAEEELGAALEPEEILEAGTLRGIAALLAR
jgi:phosphopantetheine binding protein